jgi:hypothetical protein
MDTYVALLSPANKTSLLQNATERVFQRQAEAETLLQRIKQLNLSLGTQFQLKKGAVADLTLRMIFPRDIKWIKILSLMFHHI